MLGYPIRPTSHSSRIIYAFFALAVLSLTATYTGNIVAFLSVKKIPIPFKSMAELAESTEYKFGITKGTLIDVIFYSKVNAGSPIEFINLVILFSYSI